MQRELWQRESLERVCHLDVVQPLAAHCAQTNRRSAFESDQHYLCPVKAQSGEIAGAIAQERQAKVESARQRHFTAFAVRQRPRVSIDDFDIESMLQQDRSARSRISHSDWASFVQGIKVQYG